MEDIELNSPNSICLSRCQYAVVNYHVGPLYNLKRCNYTGFTDMAQNISGFPADEILRKYLTTPHENQHKLYTHR